MAVSKLLTRRTALLAVISLSAGAVRAQTIPAIAAIEILDSALKALTKLGDAIKSLADGISYAIQVSVKGIYAVSARMTRNNLLEIRREISKFYVTANGPFLGELQGLVEFLEINAPFYSKWEDKRISLIKNHAFLAGLWKVHRRRISTLLLRGNGI